MWEVLWTMAHDQPHSVWSLWDALANRYDDQVGKLWETGRNCGFEFDLEDPPAPFGFQSTDHVVWTPSPDATIRLAWERPVDDVSGVDGYSIAVSTLARFKGLKFVGSSALRRCSAASVYLLEIPRVRDFVTQSV